METILREYIYFQFENKIMIQCLFNLKFTILIYQWTTNIHLILALQNCCLGIL
jgi:hypothetical protein